MHDTIEYDIHDVYDVVYLCGGDPDYLLRRINENNFGKQLWNYINDGGIVVGVSAGSMIFADDITNNLGLLKCGLDVHCGDEDCEKAGSYGADRMERIKLGNNQAIVFDNEKIVVIE